MNKSVGKKDWVDEIIGGVDKGMRHASMIRLLDRWVKLLGTNAPAWVKEIEGGVPEGSRHDSAIRLIGRLYGLGFKAKEVFMHLCGWNEFNQPPLPRSEIISIHKSTIHWQRPQYTPRLSDEEVRKIMVDIEKQHGQRG